MSSIRVLVCNAGTIRVFRVAEELNRHRLLDRCATSLYFEPDSFQCFPTPLRKRIEIMTVNRRCEALSGMVCTHAFPEVAHILANKFGVGDTANWIIWRNRKFGQWVARHCLDDIDVIWSFDTSSLEIFEAAKKIDIRCILDVSIAHPRLGKRIFREHAEKRPEYAADLDDHISAAHMDRRLREMELADCLVAGSSFVAESLMSEGIYENKIRVNPYGVNLEMFAGQDRSFSDVPPVFLFVGWFSQRKGIYYLLEAWEKAKIYETGAKLRLVGGHRDELHFWKKSLPENVGILGCLSHDQLPAVYAEADVFVFPSLFEGFAKVILEALASGLPVITTPHACDAAVVIDGENGLLTEPGDVAGLGAAMKLIGTDKVLMKAMSQEARVVSSKYSWSAYGELCRDICLEMAAT